MGTDEQVGRGGQVMVSGRKGATAGQEGAAGSEMKEGVTEQCGRKNRADERQENV